MSNNVPLTSNLLRHCHEYHERVGLIGADFTVNKEQDGGLRVIMKYEDDTGEEFYSGVLIDTKREVADVDHHIYLAVIVCTQCVLAQTSTIH
jgi:hypothetical protein